MAELTVVEIEKGKPQIKKSVPGEWSREELEEIVHRNNSQPDLYAACKAEEEARAYRGSSIDAERRLFNKAADLREAALAKADKN